MYVAIMRYICIHDHFLVEVIQYGPQETFGLHRFVYITDACCSAVQSILTLRCSRPPRNCTGSVVAARWTCRFSQCVFACGVQASSTTAPQPCARTPSQCVLLHFALLAPAAQSSVEILLASLCGTCAGPLDIYSYAPTFDPDATWARHANKKVLRKHWANAPISKCSCVAQARSNYYIQPFICT